MAMVLTVLNNSAAVSNGLFAPRFTMNVKGLDTRNKTLNLESRAAFWNHRQNIEQTVLESRWCRRETGHLDGDAREYRRLDFCHQRNAKESRTFGHHVHLLSPYQSSRCFGSGRQDMHVKERSTECSVGSRGHRFSLPHQWVAHLSLCCRSGRFVLLYTDLIGPSIEYEDNFDSRVLKTFLIQTLNGVNNYVFSKDDKRLMLPQENVSQMTFWLRFYTGERITPGCPMTLDLRIKWKISAQ